MDRIRRRKGGFTLIELMTVVIIVGILAIVAIPLYRGQLNRARASEGAALLGSVLTAQRVYRVENPTYAGDDDQDELGISTDGNKYFKTYEITANSATTFTATTTGTGDAANIQVTMTYSDTDGASLHYNYNYAEEAG